jgi:hypothetical protein
MVIDHHLEKWRQPIPTTTPFAPYAFPMPINMPTQKEIDEFHALLKRAREYDAKHNQPDCEMEEKRQKLLELSEQLGIKISFDEPTREPI